MPMQYENTRSTLNVMRHTIVNNRTVEGLFVRSRADSGGHNHFCHWLGSWRSTSHNRQNGLLEACGDGNSRASFIITTFSVHLSDLLYTPELHIFLNNPSSTETHHLPVQHIQYSQWEKTASQTVCRTTFVPSWPLCFAP